MKPWEAFMLHFQGGFLGHSESPCRSVGRYTPVLPAAEVYQQAWWSARWWAATPAGEEMGSVGAGAGLPTAVGQQPSEGRGEVGTPGRAEGRAAQGACSWGSHGLWRWRIRNSVHGVRPELPRRLVTLGLTQLAAPCLGMRAGHPGAVLLQESAGRQLSLWLLLA